MVNTDASGYSNLLCQTAVLSQHWSFKKHTLAKMTLDLSSAPGVKSVNNWQEVVNGKLQAPSGVSIAGSSGTVTLSSIALDNQVTARIFVGNVADSSDVVVV